MSCAGYPILNNSQLDMLAAVRSEGKITKIES